MLRPMSVDTTLMQDQGIPMQPIMLALSMTGPNHIYHHPADGYIGQIVHGPCQRISYLGIGKFRKLTCEGLCSHTVTEPASRLPTAENHP